MPVTRMSCVSCWMETPVGSRNPSPVSRQRMDGAHSCHVAPRLLTCPSAVAGCEELPYVTPMEESVCVPVGSLCR